MDEGFAARIAAELAGAPATATGVAIIRLEALRRNYRKLRALAAPAKTAAVVKANAYGLGAAEVFAALNAEGCEIAFVATIEEARALRARFPLVAIYVFDGLLPGSGPQFEDIEARPVLGSLDEIREWSAFCRDRGKRYPAALHLDTGINRLGLPAKDAEQLRGAPEMLAGFDLRLVMSHLACADDAAHGKNEAQRARFEALSALFPGTPRSLANSGGILLGPAFHFDLTRPGIALYGGRASTSSENPMEPVLWLFGRIAQLRWAEAGETVGYGAAQTLKRRTRIATVTAGYADGYFRSASASDTREGPSGYTGNYRLPLLGRVSMDLTMFDATDVPDECVRRGGFVELIGERVTADDFAAFAGTTGYEILTSLGRRYVRIYTDE